MPISRAVSIPFLLLLHGCVSGSSALVPQEWTSVPEAARIRAVALADDGKVTLATAKPKRRGGVSVDGNRLARDGKVLTEPLAAIESYHLSESRGEVVFSAKRKDNFDIGIVHVEGSEVSWVPPESVDETQVQWAPRGNKISYVVRGRGGDFIRTVHVPTSFQLAVDFVYAKIESLAWDAPAERFAVVYSTPDASDRVEVMQYRGAERRMSVPPAIRLPVEVEGFGADAVSLRPNDLVYNEKVPLVIWVDDEPFRWSDARAALLRDARVALVVTRHAPDAALWKRARETEWIDAARAFVVSGGGQALLPVPSSAGEAGQAGLPVLHITSDAKLTGRNQRREGTVVSVAPAVVQSFAARFIAAELKGNRPPNGSSRGE